MLPSLDLRAWLLVGGLLVSACPAAAQADRMVAYARLNDALVTQHVLPRYSILAEATAALAQRARTFCTALDADGLAALRADFHPAMSAWMGVQHLRFGPVTFLLRYERFAYWPDKRNSGGRHLTALLDARDQVDLAPEAFARASVAVQGFSALERLLFGETAAAGLLPGTDQESAFACQVIVAITDNLNRMAVETLESWRNGEPSYHDVIGTPGGDNPYYRDAKEVTLEFFKAFNGGLQMIADLKLARPLGADLAAARPRCAESWRSGRSLENLGANLEAFRDLYAGPGGFSGFVVEKSGDRDLDRDLRAGLAKAIASAQVIDPPLSEAFGAAGQRPAVERLLAEVRALQELVRGRLAAALGLQVGFNAFDGD